MRLKRPVFVKDGIGLVELTMGYFAVIDERDVAIVEKYNWCANVRKHTVYAQRCDSKIRLHNFITGCKYVDHRDGSGLNNCRSNLRPCGPSGNMKNSRGRTEHLKGISAHPSKSNVKCWRAQIVCDGIKHHIGLFQTEDEAHLAYSIAAEKLHGEFARTS